MVSNIGQIRYISASSCRVLWSSTQY